MVEIFLSELTIDGKTPSGQLSVAAIVSIEQFSRMNGLTGKKTKDIFKALVPDSIYNNARNLVEYCCFRFLCRDSSEVHPSLKDPAFQRFIFGTMLAWEHPYCNRKDFEAMAAERYWFLLSNECYTETAPVLTVKLHLENHRLPLSGLDNELSIFCTNRKLVGEAAFVRIAPAVSGVADWSTSHSKKILGLSSSRKPPVLKWENNMVWPGKVTLTDEALYFEGIHLEGQKDVMRLDLTKEGAQVMKTRVGQLGSDLFDSVISVSSGPEVWTQGW